MVEKKWKKKIIHRLSFKITVPETVPQSGCHYAASWSTSVNAPPSTNSHLIFSFIVWLTQADSSQQAQAVLWGEAGWEEGLQHVVCEGEGDHSLVSGVDNQHGNPQTQKAVGQHTQEVNETWQRRPVHTAAHHGHKCNTLCENTSPHYSKM